MIRVKSTCIGHCELRYVSVALLLSSLCSVLAYVVNLSLIGENHSFVMNVIIFHRYTKVNPHVPKSFFSLFGGYDL